MSVHPLIFLVAFFLIAVSFCLSQHLLFLQQHPPNFSTCSLWCAVLTGSPPCSHLSTRFSLGFFSLSYWISSYGFPEWLSTFSICFIFNPVFQRACNLVQLAFYTLKKTPSKMKTKQLCSGQLKSWIKPKPGQMPIGKTLKYPLQLDQESTILTAVPHPLKNTFPCLLIRLFSNIKEMEMT